MLTRALKTLLRKVAGRHALAEAWWRIRFAAQRRSARVVEDAEVARLRDQLSDLPAARVAVIVATYRRPAGVRAAVDSVLAQTVRDLVVLVVDDGGGQTDAVPDDPRVSVVRLSANSGSCGLARNVGIRLSRSVYLAFLDDDNTWRPQHLEHALGALHDGTGLAYTAVQRWLPDGRRLDVLGRGFSRREHRDDSWVDSNAIVLRRGPDARFVPWTRPRSVHPKEDWELVHRLSRREPVTFVNSVTVDYQVNPDSYFTDWTPGVLAGGPPRIGP